MDEVKERFVIVLVCSIGFKIQFVWVVLLEVLIQLNVVLDYSFQGQREVGSLGGQC